MGIMGNFATLMRGSPYGTVSQMMISSAAITVMIVSATAAG